eukprot:Opistho-1_new@78637
MVVLSSSVSTLARRVPAISSAVFRNVSITAGKYASSVGHGPSARAIESCGLRIFSTSRAQSALLTRSAAPLAYYPDFNAPSSRRPISDVLKHSGDGRPLPSSLVPELQSSHVRHATLADADVIYSMLEPHFKTGAILPIALDTIRNDITNYFVYVMDGEIVGSAYLKDYGRTTAELAKIVTSPAHQGKGIAGRIIVSMLATAKAEGRESVFALTLDPAMSRCFEKHGFFNVPRESLCEKWRKSYDFRRPTRAFFRSLESQGTFSESETEAKVAYA